MWSIACIKYIRYTTVQDCFTCLVHAKQLTLPGTNSIEVTSTSCYIAIPAPLLFGCGNSFFLRGCSNSESCVLCHFLEFLHEIETQLPTVVAGLMVNPVSTPFLPCISSCISTDTLVLPTYTQIHIWGSASGGTIII